MFKFPFGTMNELNLDWIITKVRELIDTAGTTKEKITFETSNGDVQFDGSEAVTINVQGVDTSGKLDKYTGGTNTLYATLGQNQANIPLPLPADYGGTGCTSLADLEIAMGLPNSYVARDTSAGLYAYGHDGSNERTIPVEISPNPAGIPYRDVNGNVRTNTPDNDKDAANKEYVDVQSSRIDALTNETKSLSGAMVQFDDGVDGAPLKSCVATITPVQSGSGDPSPTNVRAITGWTGCELKRTGKNLLRPSSQGSSSYVGLTFDFLADGKIYVHGTGTNTSATLQWVSPATVLPAGTYYYADGIGTSNNVYMRIYNNTSGDVIRNAAGSFTLTENTAVRLRAYIKGNPGAVDTTFSPRLVLGSTGISFEQYIGETVTVQFGDTIYGGQYNYLTGLLTATYNKQMFPTSGWVGQALNTNTLLVSHSVDGISSAGASYATDVICSQYKTLGDGSDTVHIAHRYSSIYVWVDKAIAQDATGWETYLSGLQTLPEFVYPLATPQTVQLSGQEVTLLADTNTIWADCGDVSIEYGGYIGALQDEIERQETVITPLVTVNSPFSKDNRTRLKVKNGMAFFTLVCNAPHTSTVPVQSEIELAQFPSEYAPSDQVQLAFANMTDTTGVVKYVTSYYDGKIKVYFDSVSDHNNGTWVWASGSWLVGG